LLFADLSSAVRALLRRRAIDELDDGVTHRWQARLRWRSVDFFSPRLCEAAVLEEGAGDHGHQCVTMKTLPGSSLEVINSEFLFQLLMGLFADPPRLDRGS
jgi:hypothetical protein